MHGGFCWLNTCSFKMIMLKSGISRIAMVMVADEWDGHGMEQRNSKTQKKTHRYEKCNIESKRAIKWHKRTAVFAACHGIYQFMVPLRLFRCTATCHRFYKLYWCLFNACGYDKYIIRKLEWLRSLSIPVNVSTKMDFGLSLQLRNDTVFGFGCIKLNFSSRDNII